MYGTVAKMKVQPGKEDQLMDLAREYESLDVPGYRGDLVYRCDEDPSICYMAVVFDSREDYVANAEDPKQHERYQAMRALLQEDPEWNDGEIIYHTLS